MLPGSTVTAVTDLIVAASPLSPFAPFLTSKTASSPSEVMNVNRLTALLSALVSVCSIFSMPLPRLPFKKRKRVVSPFVNVTVTSFVPPSLSLSVVCSIFKMPLPRAVPAWSVFSSFPDRKVTSSSPLSSISAFVTEKIPFASAISCSTWVGSGSSTGMPVSLRIEPSTGTYKGVVAYPSAYKPTSKCPSFKTVSGIDTFPFSSRSTGGLSFPSLLKRANSACLSISVSKCNA